MFAQIAQSCVYGLRLAVKPGSVVMGLAPKRHSPTALAASVLMGSGVAVCGLAGSAEAFVFSVPGTGVSTTTTAGGITTDNNWRLVAMPEYVCTDTAPSGAIPAPVDCATAPKLNPTPLASTPVYISSSVPAPWNNDIAGTNGKTIDSVLYKWITYATYPNDFGAFGTDNSQSFFNRAGSSSVPIVPGSQLTIATAQQNSQFSGNYSFIMATEFTATAGTYFLNFDASADNRFQLYLRRGALSTAQVSRTGSFTAQQPGIVGAMLLAENAANTALQFQTIWNEANSSNVQSQVTFEADTYTLFLRATDNWAASNTYGSTGAFIGSTFFAEVPGPLPILGVGAAFATSRKLRRRIRMAQSAEIRPSR